MKTKINEKLNTLDQEAATQELKLLSKSLKVAKD